MDRPDNYRYNQAYKRRNHRITYLDSKSRKYIYEGIYSFNSYREIEKRERNKFGEIVTSTQRVFDGKCEVSFTSWRLVLICNGIQEELEIFPTIYHGVFEDYRFEIRDWKAFYLNNGKCFFDMKKSPDLPKEFIDDEISITLSFNLIDPDSEIARFFLNGKSDFWGNKGDAIFKSTSNDSFNLEKLERRYNSSTPFYVFNNKYPENEYDIISRIQPSKLEKILKRKLY